MSDMLLSTVGIGDHNKFWVSGAVVLTTYFVSCVESVEMGSSKDFHN